MTGAAAQPPPRSCCAMPMSRCTWPKSAGPGDAPLTMSVNLSPRQLQHPRIVEQVRDALEASGIPPHTLTLEITETAMVRDTELSVIRLHELRELGVRLAIDDFGTGY